MNLASPLNSLGLGIQSLGRVWGVEKKTDTTTMENRVEKKQGTLSGSSGLYRGVQS